MSGGAIFVGMNKPEKKPEMRPRELKDGSGWWYVLVQWGDRPSQQIGGFPSEDEAQQWIVENSAGWFRERFEDSPFGLAPPGRPLDNPVAPMTPE